MTLKYDSTDVKIDINLEKAIAAKSLLFGQIPYGMACTGGYSGPTPCYLLCVQFEGSQIYLTVEFYNIDQSVRGSFQELVSDSKKSSFPFDAPVRQGGRIAA